MAPWQTLAQAIGGSITQRIICHIYDRQKHPRPEEMAAWFANISGVLNCWQHS
ncbi:hypothetical protein [Trichodesmium erythraeum]|uniref:hypothetical protein n=1 Tax=Trichodesmium erythraeum TaxID=1206 RepID=UPI00003C9E8A|nr:hypothetical protein [Trichodesmium erythraeum GBRTRLIN201]MDE5092717.1 hypothetical protein [Trichodesmium sp. St11_bin5]